MVILLDIDGVMVPANSWKPVELLDDGFYKFPAKAVDILNKIITVTKATIVVTSSHKSKFSLTQWKKIFGNRGIHASIKLLGKNPNGLNRQDEILNWLKRRKNNAFVIIDDDKSLNDLPEEVKQNLVQTSPLIGLDEDSFKSVIGIFKRQKKEKRITKLIEKGFFSGEEYQAMYDNTKDFEDVWLIGASIYTRLAETLKWNKAQKSKYKFIMDDYIKNDEIRRDSKDEWGIFWAYKNLEIFKKYINRVLIDIFMGIE